MTTFSRSTSVWMARTGLLLFVLGFMVFGTWTVGDLLGQANAQKKQRVEEEEDTPKAKTPPPKKKHVEEEEDAPRKKPKRKVIRVEEEDDPKSKSQQNATNGAAASGDLAQLAELATYPSIKKLFRSLAVPHDLALFKRTPGVRVNGIETQREEKIEPIPFYLGTQPSRTHERIRFVPLTSEWERGKPYDPMLNTLEMVRPYEEIAQKKVSAFLAAEQDPEDASAPRAPSTYEKLVAAEQALSSVLRWHESARQIGKRRGEEWAAVESALRKQLLDKVLLQQVKALAQAKERDKVMELVHRLALTYTDTEERQRIFRPVADMIRNGLRDPTATERGKDEARRRLRELEQEFPGNPAFQPITDTLRSEAQGLLDAAKAALKDKNEPLARRYLKSAQQTWPELPELGAFSIELNRQHPILRVGVRGELPRYLSPAWACTDSEQRVVELLFESLMKLTPDKAGGFRYRPGLAESPPRVVSLGRQFALPHNALWSDGQPLNYTDINFSFQLLKNGTGVGRSRRWSDPLDKVKSEKDPCQVTIHLKQGFLDPLALMTFKILPHDRDVNTEAFARNPISSGPFRLDGPARSDETNRECLFFVANSSYAGRPNKQGEPHIEKIRLYTYSNPLEELRNDRLDVVLDLTAKEAEELLEKQRANRLPLEVPLPSALVPNRRIYFLAINNRKVPDAKLRRALAFAVNREALLNKHFRAELKVPVHRAINGPFPGGSWACNPALNNRPNQKGLDLFDADAAKNLSVAATKPARLQLKYPRGNPVLEAVLSDLCVQIKDLTGVVIESVPCDPYQLREDVELAQNYDLAYYHYDYPDESYWLAPLLGTPPRADGSANMFRFTNAEISKLLAGTESYRDFAVVRQYQWMIHKLLYDEMPFIPLWQLDPLMAYRRHVEPGNFDPQLVFDNIEEWRVQSH